MRQRLLNVLVAFDQFCFVLLSLGVAAPDETISAAAYRMELQRKWFGRIGRPAIDWLASPFERDHCRLSAESEIKRTQISEWYRQQQG